MRRRSKAIENQTVDSEQQTDFRSTSDSVTVSSVSIQGKEREINLQKIITIQALLDILSKTAHLQNEEKFVVVPSQRNTYLKIAKPQRLREVQLCNSDKIVAETLDSLLKKYKQTFRHISNLNSVPLINILKIFYAEGVIDLPNFSTLDAVNKIQIEKTIDNLKISHKAVFFFITFDPNSQHSRSYSIDHEIHKTQSNPQTIAEANLQAFSYVCPASKKKENPFGKKQIGFQEQPQEETSKKKLRFIHKNKNPTIIDKLQNSKIDSFDNSNLFNANSTLIQQASVWEAPAENDKMEISQFIAEGRIITPPKIHNEDFDIEDAEENEDSESEQDNDDQGSWLKNSIDLGSALGRGSGQQRKAFVPILEPHKMELDMDEEFDDDF